MTKEEQKKIFSRNLRYYIDMSGHQQTEIATAIGEKLSTFNMWVQGNSMPSVIKIQKLAEYFAINKSDLVDDKAKGPDETSFFDIAYFLAKNDPKFAAIMRDYYRKDLETRTALCDFYERFIMTQGRA